MNESITKWQAQDVGLYLVFDEDREAYKLRASAQSSQSSPSSASSLDIPPPEKDKDKDKEQEAEDEERLREAVVAESEMMQEPDSELAPVDVDWAAVHQEVLDEVGDLDDDDDDDDRSMDGSDAGFDRESRR